MDRTDLQRLSKDELIDLVLQLQRPHKTSRASSKPLSTDKKEKRENSRPGGAKPGHEPHNRRLADDAENDRYTCPTGNYLTKGRMRSDAANNIDNYRNLTACATCALESPCTPRETQAPEALRPRERPRQDAGCARPHAGGHDHPPADRRVFVRNPQGMDG